MKMEKSSHAVYELGYHLIWCTKFRHKVLTGKVEVDLRHILAQTCVTYGWKLEEIEIMPDHVHLFVRADHQVAPVEIVRALKSISALHLFTRHPTLKGSKFWGTGLWSPSTYYSSVGHVSEETIRNYINTQKERG